MASVAQRLAEATALAARLQAALTSTEASLVNVKADLAAENSKNAVLVAKVATLEANIVSLKAHSLEHHKEIERLKAIIIAMGQTDPPPPPPVDPPPDPPPGELSVTQGALPSGDGWYYSGDSIPNIGTVRYVLPDVSVGQRLSGTVTVGASFKRTDGASEINQGAFAGIPKRLLVDGVPQPSFTINTNNWSNGTHALGVQVDSESHQIENGSEVVVFNNSGSAIQSKSNIAIVGQYAAPSIHTNCNSLAWARVNVVDSVAYPLGHPPHLHPEPGPGDEDSLQNDPIWWVDGLFHQGTNLYFGYPILVKNPQGDYFIRIWNPQRTTTSIGALEYVKNEPAPDGARGIGLMTPYSMAIPGIRELSSGHVGWLLVSIDGRVADVDLTGEVTTWFGHKSVAGVVPTDPDNLDFDIADRVAAGEKVFVGTGPGLVMAQDLTHIDADLIAIADTGAGKVQRVSRAAQQIVSSATIVGVTSVWYGLGAEWWVAPNTLYKNGVAFATISDAFWVRGDPTNGNLYVFQATMGLVQVNPTTAALTQRRVGEYGPQPYAFMEIDLNGTIGPRGRVYFTGVGSFDSNTGMHYMDPDVWVDNSYLNRFLNQIVNSGGGYGSQQCFDPFGHYPWAFSIHPDEAMWIATGVSNSGWKVSTAHLGGQPVPDSAIDPDVYRLGRDLSNGGKRDIAFGINAVFGMASHGGLGYTADLLRTGSVADFRALLDPMLPVSFTEQERQAIAIYQRAQRTRPHFLA